MTHRDALDRKIAPIEQYAREHGWSTTRNYGDDFDGGEGCQLVGVRGGWGFAVAYGVSERGRPVVLALDGNPRARFVLTLDGDGWWYGPLRAYGDALADPAKWTGHAT